MTHPDDANRLMMLSDPRLSEWIDGRLSTTEAAEVEQIVRQSPELTRLANDLRAIKRALSQSKTHAPNASFVQGVMQAIDAAVEQSESGVQNQKIANEWQHIEEQRIAEERAEAGEDASAVEESAGREKMLPTHWNRYWQILALSGALAAGVLVSIVIDKSRSEKDLREETALLQKKQSASPSPASPRSLAAAATAQNGTVHLSAAAAPPEGLRVRVRMQNKNGHERLEELLAASDFRIESSDSEPQQIIGTGSVEAIDALLASLAEPSESLLLEEIPLLLAAADTSATRFAPPSPLANAFPQPSLRQAKTNEIKTNEAQTNEAQTDEAQTDARAAAPGLASADLQVAAAQSVAQKSDNRNGDKAGSVSQSQAKRVAHAVRLCIEIIDDAPNDDLQGLQDPQGPQDPQSPQGVAP